MNGKTIEDLASDMEQRHLTSTPLTDPLPDSKRLLDIIQGNMEEAWEFHATLEGCNETPLVDLGNMENVGRVSDDNL